VVVAASERAPRWLALAALFAALVPSTQWVLHLNDERRALARVEAWIEGPPKPVAGARATTWDFVGMHEFVAARYDRAARAAERAVADAPNPRFYLQWGMADAMRGDYASAQARYRDAVRLNPDFTTAWVGLASASSMLDDVGECARASANIRRLDPANEHLAEIEDYLRRRGVEASR
jgi:tetratricopeptide (TPR) repeat protein